MKLLVYTIGGQKIGVDIHTWTEAMLSGNTAFITIPDNGSIPTNYVDISSVDNWDKYGANAGTSQANIKSEIIKLIPNSPTQSQYDILANYANVGINNITKIGNNITLGTIVTGSTYFTEVKDIKFNSSGGTITGPVTLTSTITSTGNTCMCAPLVCGTSCVSSPRILGSISVCSPIITGSTKVCSPIINGTTCATSPIVCGTSCSVSPIVLASTSSCSPIHCGACGYFSTAVCSPLLTGSTKVCSPIICGTTCAISPITIGSTCVCGPILLASTYSCSPVHCGACGYFSTAVCSPTITGSTRVCSPIICGTSCIQSPITIGSTCVCSPIVLGSTCMCSPKLIENGTCLINKYLTLSGGTMTGDLLFSGTAKRLIRRTTNDNTLEVMGGSSEASGAYFQITGSGATGSPYGGSAEFVIRNLAQSQFTLSSYDGVSTWTPRFSVAGQTGLVTISNNLNVSGSTTLASTTCLVATPATGSRATDQDLIWNPTDKQIKIVPAIRMLCAQATAGTTVTSTSAVCMNGMCIASVPAGTYLLNFTTSFCHTAGSGIIRTCIFVGGSVVTGSELMFQRGSSQSTVSTHNYSGYPITLVSAADVEIRWLTSASTGCSLCGRNLSLLRVG